MCSFLNCNRRVTNVSMMMMMMMRHLPTELHVYCAAKYICSSKKYRKQCPNRCIIGDAILRQTGMKLTKNAVLNLALCCGAICRHREKPQHRCTTTIHPVYNCWKKILENLLTVMTFGAHKLVHSEPFLDYRYEIWHLLSALCSDVRKFYIGAHLQSRHCSRIFFQIPQLSISVFSIN